MKKAVIAGLLAITMMVTACTQYLYVPGDIFGNDDTAAETETSAVVNDFDSMKKALESASIKEIKLNGFAFDPNDVKDQLPIKMTGEKNVTGSLNIGINEAATAYSLNTSLATKAAINTEGLTIFEIGNSANIKLTGLSITVSEETAASIKTIFSVDTGTVSADSLTISTSSDAESIPATITASQNTKAENINVSGSTDVIINIPANGDSELIEKVENDENMSLPYDALTDTELLSALETYGKARLMADISIDDSDSGEAYTFSSATNSVNVNLNNHTLFMNLSDNYAVPEYTAHVFRNGTLAIMDNKAYDPNFTYCCISVGTNASLELNNVTYNSNWGGIMTAWDAASIDIIDSRLFTYGYYGVGTNNGAQPSGIEINIIDSLIEVGNNVSELEIPMDSRITNLHEDHDGCAVFFNVAGNINIQNSKIIGGAQAVMLRGADNATITGSELVGGNDSASSTAFDMFRTNDWYTGNAAPYATVVIGNRNGDDYPAETNCTISDTEITVADDSSNSDKTPIYMASYSGHTANQTIDDTDVAASIISGNDYYGPNCKVNGITLSGN